MWVIAGQLAYAALFAAALFWMPGFHKGMLIGVHQGTLQLMFTSHQEGPVVLAIFLFNAVVLAPLSEELLFRGWLWTALRRSWGVWPTALLTGAGWWLMHVTEGPARLAVLLLLLIVISVVRHYAGTIRATIAVHALHNAIVLTMSLVALALP